MEKLVVDMTRVTTPMLSESAGDGLPPFFPQTSPLNQTYSTALSKARSTQRKRPRSKASAAVGRTSRQEDVVAQEVVASRLQKTLPGELVAQHQHHRQSGDGWSGLPSLTRPSAGRAAGGGAAGSRSMLSRGTVGSTGSLGGSGLDVPSSRPGSVASLNSIHFADDVLARASYTPPLTADQSMSRADIVKTVATLRRNADLVDVINGMQEISVCFVEVVRDVGSHRVHLGRVLNKIMSQYTLLFERLLGVMLRGQIHLDRDRQQQSAQSSRALEALESEVAELRTTCCRRSDLLAVRQNQLVVSQRRTAVMETELENLRRILVQNMEEVVRDTKQREADEAASRRRLELELKRSLRDAESKDSVGYIGDKFGLSVGSLQGVIDGVEARRTEQQDILRNMGDLLEHQGAVEQTLVSRWQARVSRLEERAAAAEGEAKRARDQARRAEEAQNAAEGKLSKLMASFQERRDDERDRHEAAMQRAAKATKAARDAARRREAELVDAQRTAGSDEADSTGLDADTANGWTQTVVDEDGLWDVRDARGPRRTGGTGSTTRHAAVASDGASDGEEGFVAQVGYELAVSGLALRRMERDFALAAKWKSMCSRCQGSLEPPPPRGADADDSGAADPGTPSIPSDGGAGGDGASAAAGVVTAAAGGPLALLASSTVVRGAGDSGSGGSGAARRRSSSMRRKSSSLHGVKGGSGARGAGDDVVPDGRWGMTDDLRHFLSNLPRTVEGQAIKPLNWLSKEVSRIYTEKRIADALDEAEGAPLQGLPAFLTEHLLLRYELRRIAELRLYELLQSVKDLWHVSPKVFLFARFLGVVTTSPTGELVSDGSDGARRESGVKGAATNRGGGTPSEEERDDPPDLDVLKAYLYALRRLRATPAQYAAELRAEREQGRRGQATATATAVATTGAGNAAPAAVTTGATTATGVAVAAMSALLSPRSQHIVTDAGGIRQYVALEHAIEVVMDVLSFMASRKLSGHLRAIERMVAARGPDGKAQRVEAGTGSSLGVRSTVRRATQTVFERRASQSSSVAGSQPSQEGDDLEGEKASSGADGAGGAESSFVVDIDAVLLIIVDVLLVRQRQIREKLLRKFVEGDDNGDGVLSYAEFHGIITRKGMAPRFSQRKTLRMFKHALTSGQGNSTAIERTAFVSVCQEYGLGALMDYARLDDDVLAKHPGPGGGGGDDDKLSM